MDLNPSLLGSAVRLARLRATNPDAALRDAGEAIQWGEHAARSTEYLDPGVLDTLAAAYAEAGDFEQAVRWQSKASELASDVERPSYEMRLEMYRGGKPWRESTAEAGT